jgi:hypothetical protein
MSIGFFFFGALLQRRIALNTSIAKAAAGLYAIFYGLRCAAAAKGFPLQTKFTEHLCKY